MKTNRVLFVASDGGHLAQILELKQIMDQYDYQIVTEKTKATVPLAKDYNIDFAYPRPEGKSRNLPFFISILKNFFFAIKKIRELKPKVIITTGSHTAIPFCIMGKMMGCKVVWILSFARINSKASSANLIYPIADKFIVQWPEMQNHYKKSIYLGSIY
jgi:beta-1,4-N-acetylglucosaminyltransferase